MVSVNKDDFLLWVRKLQETYKPSEAARQRLAQIDLLAIVGPTGVGKTTLINELGVPTVLSDVTRPMRPGEKNNQNYHFRTDYLEILNEIKAGQFVQFLVSDAGDFYGTRVDSYPSAGWCVMAVYATAIPLFRTLGFRRVLPVYIMPPGYVEWMRRIGQQRTGDLDARIAESITSLKLALVDPDYRFVLNDDVKLAVTDLQTILAGDEPYEHRSRLARETADILLERLGDQDDSMYFSNRTE